MKKLSLLMVVILIFCAACSQSAMQGTVKEIGDTIANISDSDNKYVRMVKGGYRTNNPDLTFDDAFSAFFATPRWRYFKGDEEQDVVEFTGDCMYRDVRVRALIQFVVDEENGTFEEVYLSFNEVPQDLLTLRAIIEKAFEVEDEEVQPSSQSAAPAANLYPDEIVFRGVSLSTILDSYADEIVRIIGTPKNDSISYGDHTLEYDNFIISYYDMFEDGFMSLSCWNPGDLSFNGVTLNKDRSGVLSILGNDVYEGWNEYAGDSVYRIEYLLWDTPYPVIVYFEMSSPDDNAYFVSISRYWDGPGEDDW